MLLTRRMNKAAILAAVFLCAASLAAFQQIRAGQDENLTSVVDTYARLFTTKLTERLNSRFVIAELIRDELSLGERDLHDQFLSAAATVHRQFDDLQALNWVSPEGFIEVVTPRDGNEAALGLDVMSLAAPARTLKDAAARNALRATPPITLAQGGKGFVAYLPVRRGDAIAGYINIVFRTKPIVLSAIGENAAQSFLVTIRDGAAPIHVQPIGAASARFAATTRINVGGREWTVTTAPSPAEVARAQSALDEAVLIAGFLMAIGAALLINESAYSKEALRDREERFSLAMRGASDGLFDWNPVTNEAYYSPRWFQMLGYAPDELPGSYETFISLVHPDDLGQVREDPDELYELDGDFVEKEFRMRHKDGSWRTILSRACIVRKGGTVVRIVGTHVDITELHERQRELERAAMTDDLTGLQNRRGLAASLSRQLQALKPAERLAIFHLDLDKFKSINDTSGHEAGDLALKVTAQRLRAHPTGFDLIARVGGDEFLLAKKVTSENDSVFAAANELIGDVSAPFRYKEKQCRIGASIGISFAGQGRSGDIDQTISNADIALKAAKTLGRGRCVFFEDRMRESAVHSAEITSEIEIGLERGEFRAHFQPQIEIRTGRITGFEALARWAHPTRGLLSAGDFVPFAERSHLVDAIDGQIFRQACRALQLLSSIGEQNTSVSVNMSTAQLSDPTLLERLTWTAAEAQVSPSRICIEILESTLLTERTANVVENIHELAEAGFRLELDDFGTGHTAIASLRNFPVSRIKIDRSLVTNVAEDAQLQAITEAIIELSTKLGIEVLAEGVETASEMNFLAASGCRYAQGFFVGPPLPQEALDRWVARWTAVQRGREIGSRAS